MEKRHPTLEPLLKLPSADKTTLFLHLHEIEINRGCGTRPCSMCCYAAPIYAGSMPFSVVQALHQLKVNYGHNTSYWHFKSGDPFYYESEGKNYADVVADAVNKGLYPPVINTHGWLPDETHPKLAAQQLVSWGIERGKKDLIILSIDPYGFLNTSKDVHEEAIRQTIDVIAPICGKITAFYNPDDMEIGSKDAVKALVERTIPRKLHHLVLYEKIFDAGRAKHFAQRSTEKYNPTTPGYLIDYAGNILFTDEWQAQSTKVGNIYTSIQTPLPFPIPRPPDFD